MDPKPNTVALINHTKKVEDAEREEERSCEDRDRDGSDGATQARDPGNTRS